MIDNHWNTYIRIISLILWILFMGWMIHLIQCSNGMMEHFEEGDDGTLHSNDSIKDKIEQKKAELQMKKDEAEVRALQEKIDAEDKKRQLEEESKKKKEEAEAEAKRKKEEAEKSAKDKKTEAEAKKVEVSPTVPSEKTDTPDGMMKRIYLINDEYKRLDRMNMETMTYFKENKFETVLAWYESKLKTTTVSNSQPTKTKTTEGFESSIPGQIEFTYDNVLTALNTIPEKKIKGLLDRTISALSYLAPAYQYYKLMMNDKKMREEFNTATPSTTEVTSAKSSKTDKEVNDMKLFIETNESYLETIEKNLILVRVQLDELKKYYSEQIIIESARAK
jgi:hypothetical protein